MASGKRRKEKGREKTTRASEMEKCGRTVLSPSCRKSEAEDLGLGFLFFFFTNIENIRRVITKQIFIFFTEEAMQFEKKLET